jgi:hypothetical protein
MICNTGKGALANAADVAKAIVNVSSWELFVQSGVSALDVRIVSLESNFPYSVSNVSLIE